MWTGSKIYTLETVFISLDFQRRICEDEKHKQSFENIRLGYNATLPSHLTPLGGALRDIPKTPDDVESKRVEYEQGV